MILFHVLHDDGDKEDLDCHECLLLWNGIVKISQLWNQLRLLRDI